MGSFIGALIIPGAPIGSSIGALFKVAAMLHISTGINGSQLVTAGSFIWAFLGLYSSSDNGDNLFVGIATKWLASGIDDMRVPLDVCRCG